MDPTVAPPPPPGWPAPPPPDPVAARAQSVGTGAAVAVGVGAVLVATRSLGVRGPGCPFRAATGVPCPFCGVTRISDAVLHLRLGDALGASPAGVLLVVGLGVVAVAFVLARLRHRPPPRWLGSRALLLAGGLVVASHWVTSIVRGLPAW